MNNLATRTISGVIFLAIMVAGIWLSPFSFAALFLFIMVVAMLEFQRMSIAKGRHLWARSMSILSGVTIFTTVFLWRYSLTTGKFNFDMSWILLSFIPVLIGMAFSLFEKSKEDFATVSNAYTSFVYIALPLTSANFIVFPGGSYSGLILLSFFGLIWGSDVGAYCLGCTLGKNGKKLWPAISPKKSWWGCVGGMLTAIIIAVVLYFCNVFQFHLVHCIVLAIIINIVALFGDLVESEWKRFYGIKDSGRIMPGHGGLLDRFDSTLFALPVGVIYLLCFHLI